MTALSVGNAGSLVTRTIEQAKSKDLMLRELVQNALESTSKQLSGKKKIHIRITDPSWFGLGDFYSSKKFGIFNTGPGMSANNLRKATDLSNSIGKVQGVHDNFGEGAKVSALPVNKSGMIWVSCHNKEVNMVILRLAPDPLTKEERYERQDFAAEHGTTDVVNITALFDDQEVISEIFGKTINPSQLTTDEDWTYIILCGNDPKQDTTSNPYGTKNMTGSWALNELYKRFFTIPTDVDARSEIHSQSKTHTNVLFNPVLHTLTVKSRDYPDKIQMETVSIPLLQESVNVTDPVQNGTINITYVYDGPNGKGGGGNAEKPISVVNNNSTCPLFSGIVYKNEIYDIRGGNSEGTSSWQIPAKECGILYGFRYFRVFVHIPATTNIVTDRYRTELLTNTFDKKKILFTDYKHEIYNNMPAWFREKMNEFAPKPMNLEDVHRELEELMGRVKLHYAAKKITTTTSGSRPTLKINSNPSNNRGGGHGSTNNGSSVGAALIPALSGKQKMIHQFPKIEVLSEKDIKKSSVSPNFQYKAAEYAIDTNVLFINATYPAVDMIKEDLLHTIINPSEEIENLAYQSSISLITKLVGTGLVYGLVKQGKPGYENDFEKAIDPACLSTHADRWIDDFDIARKQFEKDVKVLELKNRPSKAA